MSCSDNRGIPWMFRITEYISTSLLKKLEIVEQIRESK